MPSPHQLLASLESALRAGRTDDAKQRAAQLRAALTGSPGPVGPSGGESRSLQAELDRSRALLDRTVRVTLAEGLRPVAAEVLDGMLHIVGAQRGFVGLREGDGWRFLLARNLEQDDLDNPDRQVSSTLIQRALDEGEPVITADAVGEVDAGSVHRLSLRSVAIFPLRHDGDVLGFVYLDDDRTMGRFDDTAIEALRRWLPLVAGAVARTLTHAPVPGLPGVITRAPALLAVLDELARIARFDASVLLTGETGTGKSLIARQLHQASPRADGPFLHVNCGAIPEALLEGELFGAEPGAYTGAKVRRIGKFEAAAGGTVFLDELDAMPVSCQAKLLVALQERHITRLGGNDVIDIDVRVIAAMGRDPFRAITEGALREDLYYRLAVFVARLPALRERPEDLPLLARHLLVRTAERFGLAPLRLSERASSQLIAHQWPGNVRELENALDRAALLCKDGQIDALDLQQRPNSATASTTERPDGVTAALQHAASVLAEAMLQREDLRDPTHTRALDGALLLALHERLGSIEAVFTLLGKEQAVASRNHQRAWKRDVGRLASLAEALGDQVDEGGGSRRATTP